MECIKSINIKLNTVFFVLGSISFYCIWQHGISCSGFFFFSKMPKSKYYFDNKYAIQISHLKKKGGGGIKYAQVTQFCKM